MTARDARDTAAEVPGDPPGSAPKSDPSRRRVSRAALAALLVPTCLGLLGFFAVAAAVSSTESRVQVTLPGFLLVAAGLALAACAPLLRRLATRTTLRQCILGAGAVLLALAGSAVLAGDLVLFSLPAVPTALIGGLVLLSTSLWGQFRKGAAADPILDPPARQAEQPFGTTLLTVLGNWLLFLAAAALTAGLLLQV